jgi:hypothetical protein
MHPKKEPPVQAGGSIVLELRQLDDRTPHILRQQLAPKKQGTGEAGVCGFDIVAW